MDTILPDTLTFERKPISTEETVPAELGNFIFGSVSTLDISTHITTQLGRAAKSVGFEDASRVVLSVHDILVETDGLEAKLAETDRIKSLGDFSIIINMRKGDPVTRKIKVIPAKTTPASSTA